MSGEWPFDQPPNCAVITLRQILERSEPILHVTHDLADHGWQFLSGGNVREEDAAVVSLAEVTRLDTSVLQVAQIPPGWRAWRQSPEHEWVRERNPNDSTQ